jgi:ectoine hydroxylase-related dioxygenase (phytanoyl-CoA dioxygenase family)
MKLNSMKNTTSLNLKKFKKKYDEDGFVLIKNFIKRKDCKNALDWLKRKNKKKLVKSWTEKEPGVEAAVYFVVHKKQNQISNLLNDKKIMKFASYLANDDVYIYSSKVNFKAAWCGAVEYYHQDLAYWKHRGYPRNDMFSVMIFLESHNDLNAPLNIIPKTHKLGFINHEPFINVNGLSKSMIPPKKLSELEKKFGLYRVNAEPGDVLFFHMGCVHGSGHNISPKSRTIVLSQINTFSNKPKNVEKNSRNFNLLRAKREVLEAKRKLKWFEKKYKKQLNSKELTFHAPISSQEKNR